MELDLRVLTCFFLLLLYPLTCREALKFEIADRSLSNLDQTASNPSTSSTSQPLRAFPATVRIQVTLVVPGGTNVSVHDRKFRRVDFHRHDLTAAPYRSFFSFPHPLFNSQAVLTSKTSPYLPSDELVRRVGPRHRFMSIDDFMTCSSLQEVLDLHEQRVCPFISSFSRIFLSSYVTSTSFGSTNSLRKIKLVRTRTWTRRTWSLFQSQLDRE